MDQQKIPLDKLTGARFMRAVRNFASSPVGWKAKSMFAGLIALLFGINGMNVLNSYVGRDFMTAIADRNSAEFIRQAMIYIGVFAASTIISVVSRFLEERLGLLWREFLTKRAIGVYLADGAYYMLDATGKLTNPDQRIAEDIRSFTATTLAFVLLILNSSLTIVAFSGVVWSISPLLFVVAVVYATGGSWATIWLGRPLIELNYDQLDKEANFRSTLIHVGEHAESLKLAHREGHIAKRLISRFDDVVANLRKIIAVNRNVGFFTGFYYWMIGIIPALIVAPSYLDGAIEFGVITQSAMAFSTLVGAFSLVVTQFQSISSFTAVVARLSSLMDALEQATLKEGTDIPLTVTGERVAYERLTLPSPESGEFLLQNLTITIPFGTRVLISGPHEEANKALFKASAGLAVTGTGRIIRPGADEIMFLARRPYLLPGTLRELLVPSPPAETISDDRLKSLLQELDLEPLLTKTGGLDEEQDWNSILSLGEQQRLALIHILLSAPRFALLDRLHTALTSEQVQTVLNLLQKHAISYINFGRSDEPIDFYDAVLEIGANGTWDWHKAHP